MKLSDERINQLRLLLEQNYGLVLSDSELQQAGLAIMRFVLVKTNTDDKYYKENVHGTIEVTPSI